MWHLSLLASYLWSIYLSKSYLNIAVAQLNFLVGDIEGNCEKIRQAIVYARDQLQADCVVFSELAVIGYPPEDLLFRPRIIRRIEDELQRLKEIASDITVILGAPCSDQGKLFNAAVVMQNQQIIATYYKWQLPNIQVFDEKRYFSEGSQTCVIDIKGSVVGITICEDIWQAEPMLAARKDGAELIININASPYQFNKQRLRESEVNKRIDENNVAVVYVNQVGGQDELVFDGGSFAINHDHKICYRAAAFVEETSLLTYDQATQNLLTSDQIAALQHDDCSIYNALTFGLRDYVNKNGFNGGLIGLSGGIDSALVLTLTVDALGADKVHAVMMPSPYTSQMSLEDAREMAARLGVEYSIIKIEDICNAFTDSLERLFAGLPKDTTEENIQARTRGVLLMAISNKLGYMLISTGNKSEMSVGYATLYGDMAGGFSPLKDVLKTKVYDLARYRNSLKPDIPQRIIDRPPTAELAPDQLDQDSLPSYEELDGILKLFMEQDFCRDSIIAAGYDEATVARVIGMVFKNEYKRRQAPPGIKITQRAFGKDWRYPITAGVLKYLK